MKGNEKMKTVLVSEMHILEDFDIVRLIDDETQEFKGYFLNPKYHNIVQSLLVHKGKEANINEQ